MLKEIQNPFFLSVLPPRLQTCVQALLRQNAFVAEVRLRREQPLVCVIGAKSAFVKANGFAVPTPEGACIVTNEEMQTTFEKLCRFSVYSFQESLKQCFITLPDGSRVGLALSAVVKDGSVCSVKDVSSFNFRIASQFPGFAEPALKQMRSFGFPSAFIIGAPCSGKTTFLRDSCRALSSGLFGSFPKCVIIDQRGEIAAQFRGNRSFDIGCNTDVLSFFPKGEGIECALRTLSPEFIFLDEIASLSEAKQVLEGMNSGVKFFLSMHADNLEKARQKPSFRLLQEEGNIGAAVVLGQDYHSRVVRL